MALTDSIVAYWKLDAASGNESDSHGSNTLTVVGTVGSAAGKIGNARTNDGTGGNDLGRADNADLSTGDIDFTLQAWVYLNAKAATQILAGKWAGGEGNFEYLLWYDNTGDRWMFSVTPDGAAASLVSVTADNFGSPPTATWHLLHAWHDAAGNQLGVTVNAGTANTASHSTGVFDGASDFMLLSDGVSGLDGRADEAALWKRVLSATERSELYNGGAGLTYPFVPAVAAFVNRQPPMRRRPRVLAY